MSRLLMSRPAVAVARTLKSLEPHDRTTFTVEDVTVAALAGFAPITTYRAMLRLVELRALTIGIRSNGVRTVTLTPDHWVWLLVDTIGATS